jgi:hypothetical protein
VEDGPQVLRITSLSLAAKRSIGHIYEIGTNVIYRALESDVENVEKKTGQRVAILESNYRFSYKGIEDLNSRLLYAFTLKPHRKDPGPFKGKILIDTQTGHIVRAVVRLSKSPSWWIKRVDFIQDCVEVGDFTMFGADPFGDSGTHCGSHRGQYSALRL